MYMGKTTGFLEYERQVEISEEPNNRIKHYKEFQLALSENQTAIQAARCMDCGIPFCQSGCPVENIIPDWNDLVYRSDWFNALNMLHKTNNFPEFTGRICPAPCEAACTLNINNTPVGIKSIELAIAEKGWAMGWIQPKPALSKTNKKVAIVGSGPSGLSCAQELTRIGHEVTVFEKNDRIGGLLRYGIPDFKLEKAFIDRRIEQIESEGVRFRTNTYVCAQEEATALSQSKATWTSNKVLLDAQELLGEFDAIVLCGGAEKPRDLNIPGRDLVGIHFAMSFLFSQNQVVSGIKNRPAFSAEGKHVVVLGGGDTGSDCIGTCHRQGARSVHQLELMPRPPDQESKALTWPNWPCKFRSSSSHEEGGNREWAVLTKEFLSNSTEEVRAIHAVRIDPKSATSGLTEIPGSDFEIPADLVLLAMGFVSPSPQLLDSFSILKDTRGNAQAHFGTYTTNIKKIFTAGDMRRGQSLVVWAIREGRDCAKRVHEFLTTT